MTYSDIIDKVSQELNLPPEIVGRTYKAFFLFIRDNITNLPLKGDLTEEDFNKLNTNFNVPSLGKFTCNYDRMCKVKKRFEYINNIRKHKDEY